ncbi:RagB/SusD family nutrient uptake outer membrane protein [Pseudozobellia thermophila]|uniref:RagB/SusD domain-containing protein n=1 Tax=Pseudozobellia thermophila TaxID=192903 RepID=A0A1M6C6L8_9FLAO|nr:RagB/SusD family nutrient uptake outer membrane protein [Pseudozobellia thermophila]SHI56414.1 RagB/SusD domain-containing protein [Pseudozobellia thermophila]
MKEYIYKFLVFASVAAVMVSCEVQEFSDLNNAEVDAFEDNLTRGDLQDLVGGLFYSSRVNIGTYLDDTGVIGREWFRFSGSDPRFTTDLLGGGSAILDNNTFYITNPWSARYRTVKNGNLILDFLGSQDLSAQFTDQEVSAARGLAKTFIAYELLLNLNLTDENGIRLDVSDANNLGPFVSKTEALAGIRSFLEEGATDLANGGEAFSFIFPSGFAGFDTPSTFLQVNNAIAARVAAYQGDNEAVLSFLEDSFLNLDPQDMDTGVYYNFSEDQNSLVNPMFISANGTTAAQARIVEPSFISDAMAGDGRLSKIVQLEAPVTLDDLVGDHIVFRYQSNSDVIPIIRNEELILLYAEANIAVDPTEAVNALNIIRESAGLGAYTGATDENSLTDEMLMQRRYSLFAEGHRWIDMRRFDRLDELPLARPDDDVFAMFPIPLTENQ